MKTLEEVDAWNDKIKSAETSKDVYAILVSLIEMLKTGEFPYDNNTLQSFFEGLAGAVYTPEEADDWQPNASFWNGFARLIAMGMVYD